MAAPEMTRTYRSDRSVRSSVEEGVRRFFAHLPRRSFLLTMLAGWALITMASLAYFDLEQLPPFIVEKLPVRFESLWLWSLRVHVAAAITSLPLCTVLMTRALRRKPIVHRWLGRIAGTIVIFALVPTGVVLAFDAKGGSVVTAGFLLSAALVAWFGIRGVAAARRRDLVAHGRAMRHVFAQMSVAVTSRALLVVLDRAHVDPERAYVYALWAPVLLSAAIAELSSVNVSSVLEHIRKVFRETSRLGFVVRARALARPLVRLGR
jgi:uncharacterized membrane protein